MSLFVDVHREEILNLVLSVIRGFRNGIVYGAKVRFPHALVMAFMFRSGTIWDKLRGVLKATYTHSINLGAFVGIFKLVINILRLRSPQRQDTGTSVLLGGLVGGAIVFGENSAINSQINMYILSRIVVGMARTMVKHKYIEAPRHTFRIYGGVVWAIVMYLFYFQHTVKSPVLQSSMATSMSYLYYDSEDWPSTSNPIEWLMN